MNPYVTGAVIRQLREKSRLTQADLAERLNVSDKTVSKWETGKGYPDITLLEPIAAAFRISVTELLNGEAVCNRNGSANMLRSAFYICPVCGNVIHSMGALELHCHGVHLVPAEAEPAEDSHSIRVEVSEDEYFVRLEHDMTKEHFITFIAAVSTDRLQLVRLYPEGSAETRFRINGVKRIYAYCNRDGLFCLDLKPRRRQPV